MNVRFLLYICILILFPVMAIAADEQAVETVSGIGQVAENLLEPLGLFSNFIHTACFVLGVSFLFASIIKYIEHRRSPLMVPISTVVFLIIAGAALLLLPLLSVLSDSSVSILSDNNSLQIPLGKA